MSVVRPVRRFLERALSHFRELGLAPAEAVITNNAMNYRSSHRFQEVLAAKARGTSSLRPTRPESTARPSASYRR